MDIDASDPFYEDALDWRGVRYEITAAGDATSVTRLPPPLIAVIERAARFDWRNRDLIAACDRTNVGELVQRAWQRAKQLDADGRATWRLPADLAAFASERTALEVFEVVSSVIAAGMRYDSKLVAALARGSWLAHLRRLGDVLRTPPLGGVRSALQPDGSPGLCLDLAAAVQALFVAIQRAAGAAPDAFALVIGGDAFGRLDAGHAWNWLVDARRGTITATDPSTLSEAFRARGELELAIGVRKYRNVSGFLATLIARSPEIGDAEVAQVLSAVIDPRSQRGETLLFHVAEHFVTGGGVRDRIAAHLAARGFERTIPDWRQRLDRRTAQVNRLLRHVVQTSGLQALGALQLAA